MSRPGPHRPASTPVPRVRREKGRVSGVFRISEASPGRFGRPPSIHRTRGRLRPIEAKNMLATAAQHRERRPGHPIERRVGEAEQGEHGDEQ